MLANIPNHRCLPIYIARPVKQMSLKLAPKDCLCIQILGGTMYKFLVFLGCGFFLFIMCVLGFESEALQPNKLIKRVLTACVFCVAGCSRSWVSGSGRSGCGFRRAWAGLTWRIGMDEYTPKPATCGWRCPSRSYSSLFVRSLRGQSIFYSFTQYLCSLSASLVINSNICFLYIYTYFPVILSSLLSSSATFTSFFSPSVWPSVISSWPLIRLFYLRMQFFFAFFLSTYLILLTQFPLQ